MTLTAPPRDRPRPRPSSVLRYDRENLWLVEKWSRNPSISSRVNREDSSHRTPAGQRRRPCEVAGGLGRDVLGAGDAKGTSVGAEATAGRAGDCVFVPGPVRNHNHLF